MDVCVRSSTTGADRRGVSLEKRYLPIPPLPLLLSLRMYMWFRSRVVYSLAIGGEAEGLPDLVISSPRGILSR